MRPVGEAGYILTTDELFILAGLTGAEVFTGIDMKFTCDDEKQATSILEKAKAGLLQKKYIVEHNHTLKVDQNLFYLIKVCCQPDAIIRISFFNGTTRCHRLYYFGRQVTVELDEMNRVHDVYVLTPIMTKEKLIYNLEECLFSERPDYMNDKMLQVPMEALRRFIVSKEKYSSVEIEKQLVDLGVDKSSAEDLALPLNRREERTVLVMMLNDNKQFWNSIIPGKRYLWKATQATDDPSKAVIKVIRNNEIKSLIIQTIESIHHKNLIQG